MLNFYFNSIKILKGFFRNLYETKSIQMVPFFGYFPVKLRTFVGKPIAFEEGRTVDELVELVR